MLRHGEIHPVLGAGAKANFELLQSSGANSIRLWSTNKSALLDSAHARGMSVMLGLYLRPERTGMDYNDVHAVEGQLAELKQEILKHKDHPALLLWGIGNEVDLQYTNTRVWDSVEALAKFIHQVDPHHPTSTVLAGIDPAKIHMVQTHCPNVDVLGVNAYGSIEKLPLNIRRFGWDKPYVVTEWGVNGPFEAPKTAWGAKKEPPGGVKAATRLRRFEEIIAADSARCLGSYCFLWGQKQESTATWHGLFLSDGQPTDGVDAMHHAWSGGMAYYPGAWDCGLETEWQGLAQGPRGSGWRGPAIGGGGRRPRCRGALDVRLVPRVDLDQNRGDRQASLKEVPASFEVSPGPIVEFTAPQEPGAYRVFVRACNTTDQCSSANLPFLVSAPKK